MTDYDCWHDFEEDVCVSSVVETLKKHPNVTYAVDYTYMCSDPGQELIKSAIKEKKLDGVIVSACSPTLHEITFRNAIAAADSRRR